MLTRQCPICEAAPVATPKQLGGYTLFRCTSCDLYFAPDAFDTLVDYTSIYSTPEYEANQRNDLLRLIHTPEEFASYITYRPFFKQVVRRPGARLLDIGCGVGRFCHAAYTRGWDVVGIDISKQAITVAAQFAQFPVYDLDIAQMISRGERYDVLTAFEVIEHLAEPLEFLRQCREMLKADGLFFCTVPNWHCPRVQNTTKIDWLPPVHLCFYTTTSLERLGYQAGFQRVVVGRIWTDPFPTSGTKERLKWLLRRLAGRKREPLGLWMHAE